MVGDFSYDSDEKIMHELEGLYSIEVAKVKRKRRKTKQRKAKDIERNANAYDDTIRYWTRTGFWNAKRHF